ncbi:hypothetical protein [Pseudomonas sp. 18173]|uniref:hypothetical protein n=1 Tax=Pseudomonas sp. 18173 TaxID=3390055 RepID=UPI003D1D4471
MNEENRDFIFFQEDDFISLRAYELFLNEVLHKDFITHSTPVTSEVLGAYAQGLSEAAESNLTRFWSLVDDVEGIRAQVRIYDNQVRTFQYIFLEAKPTVPLYRRAAVDTLECDLFDLNQKNLAICNTYKVSGLVSDLLDNCKVTLKNVEQYSFNVNSMEREVHPMFYRILAARKQQIEANGFSPEKPPAGSGTSPFDFRTPFRADPTPQTLELYRLTRVYACASSALFNFGHFLNRVQQLFRVMIDRLSLITASSTYSTLLLTLNLVASQLTPLQLRMNRLQDWSDFIRYRGKYAVEDS